MLLLYYNTILHNMVTSILNDIMGSIVKSIMQSIMQSIMYPIMESILHHLRIMVRSLPTVLLWNSGCCHLSLPTMPGQLLSDLLPIRQYLNKLIQPYSFGGV